MNWAVSNGYEARWNTSQGWEVNPILEVYEQPCSQIRVALKCWMLYHGLLPAEQSFFRFPWLALWSAGFTKLASVRYDMELWNPAQFLWKQSFALCTWTLDVKVWLMTSLRMCATYLANTSLYILSNTYMLIHSKTKPHSWCILEKIALLYPIAV